ncbi:hypothetical protein CFP56_034788 [Quercus suber]|uniref:Uncharacterized protein n=1 Tax=Quercus suber TaxID=58331 RepID=A0AAW0LRQ9_QUESU
MRCRRMRMRFGRFVRDGVEDDSGEIRHKNFKCLGKEELAGEEGSIKPIKDSSEGGKSERDNIEWEGANNEKRKRR